MLGLKGLREERAPEEDGRPEEEDEEAERFRESEGELGQREGVGCDEGEEAEGYQVVFHGFVLVLSRLQRASLVQGWCNMRGIAMRKCAKNARREKRVSRFTASMVCSGLVRWL